MQHFVSDHHYVLIFQKGEALIANLEGFCEAHDIQAGFFHGLGGALNVELGYYHLGKQDYEFHHLEDTLEIASLHGNVALKDDQPSIHAHGVFSDPELKTYGGHIKELVVGGTCEIYLRAFQSSWKRLPDDDTGLNPININTYQHET